MRTLTMLLALSVALTLPACEKLEQKAEAKAESTVERKLTGQSWSAMGGSLTEGLCPDWPKNVPVYRGAKNIFCQEMDSAKLQASPGFQAYMATRPESEQKGPHPDFDAYMLSFETSDAIGDVDAFYAKNLSSPADIARAPSLIPIKPLLAREATRDNPVSLVLRMQGISPPSGQTQVTLMVESVKAK